MAFVQYFVVENAQFFSKSAFFQMKYSTDGMDPNDFDTKNSPVQVMFSNVLFRCVPWTNGLYVLCNIVSGKVSVVWCLFNLNPNLQNYSIILDGTRVAFNYFVCILPGDCFTKPCPNQTVYYTQLLLFAFFYHT